MLCWICNGHFSFDIRTSNVICIVFLYIVMNCFHYRHHTLFSNKYFIATYAGNLHFKILPRPVSAESQHLIILLINIVLVEQELDNYENYMHNEPTVKTKWLHRPCDYVFDNALVTVLSLSSKW